MVGSPVTSVADLEEAIKVYRADVEVSMAGPDVPSSVAASVKLVTELVSEAPALIRRLDQLARDARTLRDDQAALAAARHELALRQVVIEQRTRSLNSMQEVLDAKEEVFNLQFDTMEEEVDRATATVAARDQELEDLRKVLVKSIEDLKRLRTEHHDLVRSIDSTLADVKDVAAQVTVSALESEDLKR
ncbi:hypothetical protein Micbo1qcDRAFT_206410 [Microdochium bolleyi]|uniref:Uncharacterized protein n=1 Tax=Microdochium bolleyi TaxID=196109 RepID=A0A136IXG1_9PEZI|nr:hypothetical protein Micbo1qcDRAFT_206410 [Microdochium bolleyi]